MTQAGTMNVASDGTERHASPNSSQRLHIVFMGVIATITGERELTLAFDQSQTLRDLLYSLEQRFGPEFGARVFRNATPPRRLQMGMRIFINKNLIDERVLDQPVSMITEQQQSAEILIYFLPAACGG
jgi:hypothetical protein